MLDSIESGVPELVAKNMAMDNVVSMHDQKMISTDQYYRCIDKLGDIYRAISSERIYQ